MDDTGTLAPIAQPEISLRVRPRVYIETSVISYLTARPSRDLIVAAHQALTREWWEAVLPLVDPMISPLVIEEAGRGDAEAAQARLVVLESIPLVPLSAQALQLAGLYLARGLVPAKAGADAAHLALASVAGADYLLTWNCRHLARDGVRRGLAELNQSAGVGIPHLVTPEDLMEVEDGAIS